MLKVTQLPRMFRRKNVADLPTPEDNRLDCQLSLPLNPNDDQILPVTHPNHAQDRGHPHDDEAKSDTEIPRTESESSSSSCSSVEFAAESSTNASAPSRLGRVYQALNRGIYLRSAPSSANDKQPSHSESLASDIVLPEIGARVSTHFGLGTVSDVTKDGSLVIPLFGFESVVLYLRSYQEVHVIPALPNELVTTANGKARVVSYDGITRKYLVVFDNDNNESETCYGIDEVQLSHEARQARASSMLYQAVASVASACGSICTTSTEMTSSTLSTLAYGTSTRFYRGQLVVTPYGGGTVSAPGSVTHSARVQLAFGATAYLTQDMILGQVKAIEGTEVNSKFGSGRVVSIRARDSIYCVHLNGNQQEGESDVVYVPECDLQVVKPVAKNGVSAAAASATSRLGSFSKGVKDRWLPIMKVRVAGGYI